MSVIFLDWPGVVGGGGGSSITFVGRQAHLISSTSTTLAINGLTGGIASAPAENDVVIVHYGIGTLANRNPAVTGYTSIASIHFDGASRDVNLAIAWKAMGATPDTTVSVTATNSSGSMSIVLVEVWRGVNTTTPMDATPTTDSGDGTVLPNPASITPVTSGAKVVACGVGSHTAGAVNFSSSDLSNVYAGNNDGTNDVSMLCGSVDWTSGAVDPAAFTFGASDSSGYCRTAVTYALKPA